MVAAALPASDEVVLVAHSLGAMVIPLLGGKPWDEGPSMQAPGVTSPMVRADDGAMSWSDVEAARAAMYNTSDPSDAAWCFSQLRPQNSSSLWGEYPLATWPDAPMITIGCTEDRIVSVEWSRHTTERLGVELVEIEGDHSPFLSRPGELADVVLERLPNAG